LLTLLVLIIFEGTTESLGAALDGGASALLA
jgi:hypothetical protein